MTRRRIILTTTGLLLAAATWRVEHAYRYHYDTLRTEGRTTTRLFGIPVKFKDELPTPGDPDFDPYPGLYQQITGKEPDPKRWLQNRPDHIYSYWNDVYICGGSTIDWENRLQLLAAVYQKFRDGGPKAEATAHLQRIDALLPIPANPNQETDYEAVEAFKKELGLKKK